MVALLVRLRFRVLANTLARNPLQLVAVILGGCAVLPVLPLVGFGAWQTADFDPGTPLVIAGSLLVLGWAVVPLFVGGVEQTLDPQRLAPFPLRRSQLIAAGMVVGATWIPGVLTILGCLLALLAFHRYPVIALIALVCVLLGAATAIAASRAVASLAGVLLAGRSRLTRIGVVAAMIAVLAVPAAIGAIVGITSPNTLFDAARALAWTPLGAAWAIPNEVAVLLYVPDAPAAGWAAQLAGSIVVALGSLVGALAVWRYALGAALTRSGDARGSIRSRGLGPLAIVPANPVGAVAGRSLHYWFRDPRYARQLLAVVILPLLFLLWARVTGAAGIGIAAGPVVAALLPLATFAGISYDGTAFAASLAAGVRGRDDRIGRAAALLVIAVPLVFGVQLALVAVLDRWVDLPAVLGMTAGVLLTSLAVVSVSSARLVIPVPRAGRNPFSASAGAGATSIAASYAVTGITSALALPEIALGIVAAVTGSALLGWICFATGLVLGGALLAAGIRVGGAILDARGPEVLARLRAIRV